MKVKVFASLLMIAIVGYCSISYARSGAYQESKTRLTNDDVLGMVRSEIGTEIIVAKIRTSDCQFDTSPETLTSLKDAGVPDAVVLAMIQCSTVTTTNLASPSGEEVSKTESAPIDTHATVYIYRLKDFTTRNMHPSVWVDGVKAARMDDGKFFIIKLSPGKHSVLANDKESGIDVEMKAGEKYYFQIRIKTGFWSSHSEVDFVQKEQGASQIQKTKPLENKWIIDKARVTAEDDTLHP